MSPPWQFHLSTCMSLLSLLLLVSTLDVTCSSQGNPPYGAAADFRGLLSGGRGSRPLQGVDPMGAWEGFWQRSGTVQQQSQEAAVMGEGPSCSEMGMLVTLGGLCGPFNRHIARSCFFLHYGLLVSRKSCPELYRNAGI